MNYIIKTEQHFDNIIAGLDDDELRDLRAGVRWLATVPEAIEKESKWSYKDAQGRWWRSYEALGLIVFFRLVGNVLMLGDVWRRHEFTGFEV